MTLSLTLRQALALFVLSSWTYVACARSTAPSRALPVEASPAPARGTDVIVELRGASSGGADDASVAPVPVTNLDPQWGDKLAPVTIVEFSDFECPFCGRVEPTLARVRDEFGPTKVRIVWKNYPLSFHVHAKPTHEAAMAVFALGGNEAFWRFHELAFANQRSFDDAHYEAWAVSSGIDLAAFRTAYAEKRGAGKVEQDSKLADALGTNGTPHFLVNGVPIRGAQPYEKFDEVIQDQLRQAAALVRAGTRPEDVYATLTRRQFEPNAKPSPVPGVAKKEDKTVWRVPVLPDDPVRGPADALVTIVEFSDFQCPFCKRVEPTLRELTQKYGDDIRLVWKDQPLPFHARARAAAAFGRFAYSKRGNAAFWQAHARLFETAPLLEDDDFERLAKELSLPWPELKRAIDQKRFDERIGDSMALAEDLNARGTPAFFINGIRLSGTQPLDRFTTIIDEELVKARARVAAGLPRAQLYAAIAKDAREPDRPEKKPLPPVDPRAPTRGSKQAKLLIHEWGDFQCPYTARAEETLTALRKEFGSSLAIVWHDMPLAFHPHAMEAAEVGREVLKQKGQAAFFAFHDRLLEAQSTEGALEHESLMRLAQAQGVNIARLEAALERGEHRADIQAQSDVGAGAGVTGTPSFWVNGYFIMGAEPIAKFRRALRR